LERTELIAWLDAGEDWDYIAADDDLLVIFRPDNENRAVTRIEPHAIAENTLETITAACKQGRDVDHITRVTGYFARTSSFNAGKAGELADRHRVTV